MKTVSWHRCLWFALVTYGYAPALFLVGLAAFGYAPNFGGGRSTEMYIWYFGCLAPGASILLAKFVAHISVRELSRPSTMLLITWFPYMFLSGGVVISLHDKAIYG